MSRSNKRVQDMRHLLNRQCQDLQQRKQTLRRDQSHEGLSSPGDTMDAVKSLLDVETHAALIERTEKQLMEIDSALARINEGNYGKCVNCGEEIAIERLHAIPSTTYCIDCKSAMSSETSDETADRTEFRTWTPAKEADENELFSDEDSDAVSHLEIETDIGSGAVDVANGTSGLRRAKKGMRDASTRDGK